MEYGYVIASPAYPLLCSSLIVRVAYVVIDGVYLIYVETYVSMTAREAMRSLQVEGACMPWTVNWSSALKHCKRHGVVYDSIVNMTPSVQTPNCQPIPRYRTYRSS